MVGTKSELFLGAKFQDPYTTRDGHLAIYQKMVFDTNGESKHILFTEDDKLVCQDDGTCQKNKWLDVICRYKDFKVPMPDLKMDFKMDLKSPDSVQEQTKNLKPKYKLGDVLISSTDARVGRVENISDSLYCGAFCYFINGVWKSETILKLYKEPNSPYRFETFEKVLVRYDDTDDWMPHLFSYIKEGLSTPRYVCIGDSDHLYPQCIPYEGNEDIAFTTLKPKSIYN